MGAALAALAVAECGGPQPVVLLSVAGTGNAGETIDSPSSRGWDMAWSYDCSKSGGRGVFVVDVYDAGRTPDFKHPGVSEEGDADSAVYHVPGAGRFYLDVTTTCAWTLRVVASA